MPGFKKGVTGACIMLGNLGEEAERFKAVARFAAAVLGARDTCLMEHGLRSAKTTCLQLELSLERGK